jgi:iron complex outermembrane receptor protein
MISSAVKRRAPAMKPLALATAIAAFFNVPAFADEQAMPAVTITGARFDSDPALAPVGAIVITAEDIRRAGANDVNAAIRKVGGVYGRQSLDGSPDFGLDLRGFGANSSENLVVMVDGVRLSENELSGSVLSTIPVDTVERIEIIRGGASVLYGEGATGGVIRIVTKRGKEGGHHGSLVAEAGSFGLRDLRASLRQGWDGFTFDAAVADTRTDNYRAHNEFTNRSFSGGIAYAWQDGRAGVRAEKATQDAQFPGSLTQAQFDADPRQASTLKDFGSLDGKRVSAFVEQRVGAVDFAAELSRREKTVGATYYYTFGGTEVTSPSTYDSTQNQFSPRLRHLAKFDGMLNELVAGADIIRWNRKVTSSYSLADATQKSKAFYLRDELRFDAQHNARVSLGARHESFDKDTVDPIGMPPDHAKQSQNAWELQGSMDVQPQMNLFAKAGTSYRVPNVDENGFRPTPEVLKVQTSHDFEAGLVLGDATNKVSARLFRHQLKNEIFYDPTANGYGSNVNLDPTRRQGVELDGQVMIAPQWRLSSHYQHVKASFTDGARSGREMVLVPKNVLTARLSWLGENGQSADIGAQWVDSQRFGGDFANTCAARVPAYATFDGRYARRFGAWEFAVAGLNLADRSYYSNAYGCRSGIYPSDGRQLKLSARYDF